MTREERNRKARERMAKWRKSPAYKLWLERSRERRRADKERYRREAGCTPRILITERAIKRRAEAQAVVEGRKALRTEFNMRFVGPPTPSACLGDAEYGRWLYKNNPAVAQYQRNKRHRYVETVTVAYAREQLRLNDAPAELVEAKRLFLLNKRALESLNEDNI